MKKLCAILTVCLVLPLMTNAEICFQVNADANFTGIDGFILPYINPKALVLYEFPQIDKLSILAGAGAVSHYGKILPLLALEGTYEVSQNDTNELSVHWALDGGLTPYKEYWYDSDGNFEGSGIPYIYASTAILASWLWPQTKLYAQVGPSFSVLRKHIGLPQYFWDLGIRGTFGIRF